LKVLLAFLANTATNFIIGLMVAKFLGPEEYGRFALAFSIAVVVQTALYDWLRLSATRFYSQRTRENEPVIRSTLGTSFVVVSVFLALSTLLYIKTKNKRYLTIKQKSIDQQNTHTEKKDQ
jgi:O-antigen/teichoic acid export membrane protein